MKRIALLLLSVLMVLGACRETPEEKKETWMGTPEPTATSTAAAAGVETDTASATHPASPGGTAIVPSVAAGSTVLVMLNENSIALPGQGIPAGPAVLTVENRGSDVHNLFIEGPGVSRAAGDAIPEGQSRTVDVTFQAGTYTFYCPIGDHRTAKGEQAQVTIAAP